MAPLPLPLTRNKSRPGCWDHGTPQPNKISQNRSVSNKNRFFETASNFSAFFSMFFVSWKVLAQPTEKISQNRSVCDENIFFETAAKNGIFNFFFIFSRPLEKNCLTGKTWAQPTSFGQNSSVLNENIFLKPHPKYMWHIFVFFFFSVGKVRPTDKIRSQPTVCCHNRQIWAQPTSVGNQQPFRSTPLPPSAPSPRDRPAFFHPHGPGPPKFSQCLGAEMAQTATKSRFPAPGVSNKKKCRIQKN